MFTIESYQAGDGIHIDGKPAIRKVEKTTTGGFLHVADLGPTENPVHRSRVTKSKEAPNKAEQPSNVVEFRLKPHYDDLIA